MFLCDKEILNDFSTLTLKQIFWKTKAFFRKHEYCFLVESTKIGKSSFPNKTVISEKPMSSQIKWWVQNGPITKNRVLTVITLFVWKFCFSLRTSYKELIWFTSDSNAHIPTFCIRWNFIRGCFFLVSTLKVPQYTYKALSMFSTPLSQFLGGGFENNSLLIHRHFEE